MGDSYLDSAVFLRDLGREPILIDRAEGVYLFDRAGKRYLDAASGAAVTSLGHGNLELAQVLFEQARRLNYAHPSKFVTSEVAELAEKMVARAPEGLTRVLFTSGGSEATEAAVKLARQVHLARGATDKYKVITRRNSYHGSTLGALALSGQTGRRQPFVPMLMSQPMIAPTSCYRCPFGQEPRSCSLECADDLETTLLSEGPENVAAFIAEPIVGSSAPGRHPPDGYWRRVREICDRYQVLLVADEVMSGNGRSGKWWAMQHTGVVPDMITTAKGIGAGYTPLGAVLVKGEFVEDLRKIDESFRHGHTYAGNPLSCAVGSRVIDIIERDGLLANVHRMGVRLLRRLEETFFDHPNVGVIRGRGLLLGVELVADRASKRPFPAELGIRSRFSHACLAQGLYLYQGGGHIDGHSGDHAMLAPPFIIDESGVEEIIAMMATALEEILPGGAPA
jgi:adenosylmethionine-8-amino-7-oxononanoate aminotransferase